MLEKGDLLVPIETPAGPAVAREAWADELEHLLVVVRVLDGDRVRVNCPSTGETVERPAADVLESYERSDEGPPRSWAAFLTRVATECARVERRAGEEEATYWQRVAAIATRVRVEESDVFREEVTRLEEAGPALADLEERVLGPFVSTSETSRRAALQAYPKQGTQRARIVAYFERLHRNAERQHPLPRDVHAFELDAGAQRDAIARALDLSPNAVRPRVVELIGGGWLRETEWTVPTGAGGDGALLVLSAKAIEYLEAKAA